MSEILYVNLRKNQEKMRSTCICKYERNDKQTDQHKSRVALNSNLSCN